MNDQEQAAVMRDAEDESTENLEAAEAILDKVQADKPPDQPGLLVAFTFFASDSVAFRYERSPGVSPWQLLAMSEHLRIEGELELQAWMLERRREAAGIVPMTPPPNRRGIREVFKGGKWKPPAERKG